MRELLREYMDYSDISTVKQLSLLSEANQNQFLVSLTSRLYDKIQEKATKIDFSTVEMSRGDITKIQNYTSIVECLELIRKIVLEYKQDPAAVDTVLKAINNLNDRSRTFKKAFAMGTHLPILIYNTTALSIVEATSFLISVCIEYVKDPSMETFQMALDTTAYQKTKQNLLFTSLGEFNKSCTDNSLDNALNMVLSQVVANREAANIKYMKEDQIEQDHPFMSDEEIEAGNTSVVLDDDQPQEVQESNFGTFLSYHATKSLLWICKKLIPVIRSIVYWHYLHKQKKSDYYADQADMLQMNAMQLQYRDDIPEQQKKEIIARQMKIAERYRKRANEMSIDYMVAKKGADKLANEEAKKFKAEEVQDDSDMSSYASIFESTMNDDIGELVFESPFEAATIEDRVEYFEEKGFLKKATLGFKINSGVDICEVYKAHKHQKMLDYVNKCNDIEILQYIKKDTQAGKSQFKTIKERISAVEKNPNLDNDWAGNIKKMYIDKGVKSSDIEAYEGWLKNTLISRINERIKELKK